MMNVQRMGMFVALGSVVFHWTVTSQVGVRRRRFTFQDNFLVVGSNLAGTLPKPETVMVGDSGRRFSIFARSAVIVGRRFVVVVPGSGLTG